MPRLLAMMRPAVLVAGLLLPLSVSAQNLDKSNALTIVRDSKTGTWTSTCDISVNGIDPSQVYSGRMLFQFSAESQGTATIAFDALFQVDRNDQTWTESSPGIYEVTARLKGREVKVHAEVTFATVNPGDNIFCDSRIDLAGPPVTTLFGTKMRLIVNQP